MTFYCTTNTKTWNGHKTNELVIFKVVVVTIYKRYHTVSIKLTNLMLLKSI